MFLIDSSVWIDYLRKSPTPARDWMHSTIERELHAVASCDPIIMELLAGAPKGGLVRLEQLTNGLPVLPMDPAADFRQAAAYMRVARESGLTVRGLLNCLICAIAARSGATLVHKDRDFEVLCAIAGAQSVDLR